MIDPNMGRLTCISTLSSPLPSSLHASSTFNNTHDESESHSSVEALLASHLRPSMILSYTTSPIWSCAFSSDGKRLASCHGAPDSCVRIWARHKRQKDGENWVLIATLQSDQKRSRRTVRSVSFAPVTSPNLRYILAVASFDGVVSIWEDLSIDSHNLEDSFPTSYLPSPNGWECTAQLEGHENEVKDVTWNSTGTLLATCGRDKSVWIWECFLPGSIGGDGTGQRYSPASGTTGGGGEGEYECIAVLQGHSGDVKCIRFAPSHGQWGDGDDILLSASYDDTIKCWAEDAGEWYCAMTLSGVHDSTIWSISLSSSGLRMISASADGTLAEWKCLSATERKTLYPQDNSKAVCATDGSWKSVRKMNLSENNQLPIYSVDCASSKAGHGCFACTGSDSCIRIYRETRSSLTDPPSFVLDAYATQTHHSDVNCIRWHPTDGTKLVSCGDDGLIRLWRYECT